MSIVDRPWLIIDIPPSQKTIEPVTAFADLLASSMKMSA
jgi:hypothetical protein